MPIVNYVREHMRFIEYASDEHLTSSERLVWYALMHIMNQRAQGNVWPEEFIRISNDRLLSYCPMKFDTMAQARNALKQRGLIDIMPGEKNKKSPAYRMIYFYPQYAAPKTELDGECYPEKSDYHGDNMGDNHGDNMGDNHGDNMGDYMGDNTINLNIKPHLPLNGNPGNPEEDEDEEDTTPVSRAREEAESAWRSNFGTKPNPAAVALIANKAELFRFRGGVIASALRMAAERNANSPVDYVLSLFRDWHYYGVTTVDGLEEYLSLREDIDDGTIRADDGCRMLERFRQTGSTDGWEDL